MRLLIDSSVVIDAITHRGPQYSAAKLLLMLGYTSEFELWMSPTQLTDVVHTVGSVVSNVSGYLLKLTQSVHVAQFSPVEFESSTARLWRDFSASLVFESALSIKAEAIITSNPDKFIASTIPVYDCEGFFHRLKSVYKIDYAEIVGLQNTSDLMQ
jgi:predicted nucleic acid-binding protein